MLRVSSRWGTVAGNGFERRHLLRVAAGLHPVPAEVAVDRRLVDRRESIDPAGPPEQREVAVDRGRSIRPSSRR